MNWRSPAMNLFVDDGNSAVSLPEVPCLLFLARRVDALWKENVARSR